MNNKKILGLAVASVLVSSTAAAGLFINPIVKGSVETGSEQAPTAQASASGSGFVIEPKDKPQVVRGSSESGDYVMSEEVSDTKKVFAYGKDVPLSIALSKVIPDASSWLIKYDDGLSDKAVSWDGGLTWEGVVSEIDKNNPINIVLNHSEKVIGVAIPRDLATAMASRTAKVFKLDGEVSLQENLASWGKQAGYQRVIFSPEVEDVDYPVPDALFLGALNEKGGALDMLLTSLNQDARIKLDADIREGNKVIRIIKKASQKETF